MIFCLIVGLYFSNNNPISDVGYEKYLWKNVVVIIGIIIEGFIVANILETNKMRKKHVLYAIIAWIVGGILAIIAFIAILYMYDFYRQYIL